MLSIVWARYLTLDRGMSGNFSRLVVWIIGGSIVIFILFWFITWCVNRWILGEAFIQLTNPQDYECANSWEGIVLINLLGLFVLNGIILTAFVNWVSNRKNVITTAKPDIHIYKPNGSP